MFDYTLGSLVGSVNMHGPFEWNSPNYMKQYMYTCLACLEVREFNGLSACLISIAKQ